MSSRLFAKFCAICEREKRQSTAESCRNDPTENSAEATTTNNVFGNRYGNLPANKLDDFYTQVTEPQWLRRGNLKETDHVCKRHLAILMRGADRGCEGGCCSPLHRGARLCRPGNLKSIPPLWRKRFMKHPKIKEEDKSLMLLCWNCYKKHMDRMSKYGDPMGRNFGTKQGIQRSHSLIDADSGSDILRAMKRYRSMEKLDSGEISLINISPRSTEKSSWSRALSSSPPIGTEHGSDGNSPELHVDTESKSFSRRSGRARKMNKDRRRSPSPPNNISPVRTSVVHSRRRHSPYKNSKSPSPRVSEAFNSDEATSSNAPSQKIRHEIDEGALADTESPRPAPVPPKGLFSPRSDRSADVIDVFGTRRSKSPKNALTDDHTDKTCEDSPKLHVKMELSKKSQTPLTRHANVLSCVEADMTTITDSHESTLETVYPEKQITVDEMRNVDGIAISNLGEESVTSSDEMAGIFGEDNQTLGESKPEVPSRVLANGFHKESDDINQEQCNTFVDEIPMGLEVSHKHESSGSSSDETGETQIAVESFVKNPLENEECAEREGRTNDGIKDNPNNDGCNSSTNLPDEEIHEHSVPTTAECAVQTPETSFSIDDVKESMFVSPRRLRDPEGSSPKITNSTLNYSLSPQSFRRLDSIKLSFNVVTNEDGNDEGLNIKSYLGDDVKESSHPLRAQVLVKMPRIGQKQKRSSFIRLAAEDVDIFPDMMSFLEGVTQTVGDVCMYSADQVQLAKVDLLKEINSEVHRTAGLTDEQLVVRRGQSFKISLELNETFEQQKHAIILELMTGDQPRVSNGTHIFLPVQVNELVPLHHDPQKGNGWSARLSKHEGNTLHITLNSPCTCPIGTFSIFFQIYTDGKRSRWIPESEEDRSIIILFNPWSIDDSVFMSSQSDRHEYVLADTGCIYAGDKNHIRKLPCIFGQYEEVVLTSCIQILRECLLPQSKKSDPGSVTWAISRFIAEHVTDDCTPLDERYGNDTTCGSKDLLRQFLLTGSLRVPKDHFAISALLVTVFRALGLPSRPVTCYDCACDTELPLVVNLHYSEDGQVLEYLNSDAIWPCFTWVEVWMSRVDLPPGLGGWQAILSSDNREKYLGPTPVYTIKKGQTSCCAGTQMYFSALNSDKKHWIVSQDGSMERIQTDKSQSGMMVITKSNGNSESQDITKLYKFNDGSEENKLALHMARMHCGNQGLYDDQNDKRDIVMSLSTYPNVIKYGSDVDVITQVVNKTSDVIHMTINIDGAILSGDGSIVLELPRETILAEVLKGESVKIPVKFNLLACLHKLSSDFHLRFTAFAHVRENPRARLICSHLVGVEYPHVEIQVHGEFKVGGEVTVSTRVRNPLSYVLRKARMLISASGLNAVNISSASGKSVAPWRTFKYERVYRCQNSGNHTIVARFISDLMSGPVGFQEFSIA